MGSHEGCNLLSGRHETTRASPAAAFIHPSLFVANETITRSSARRADGHDGPLCTSGPRPGTPTAVGRRGTRHGAAQRSTPRRTCPRPTGLGRNLRSKTRWFAGFCNSHHVSHFAALFIDARAEISIVESRVNTCGAQHRSAPRRPDAGLVPFDSYLGANLRRFWVSAAPRRGPLQWGGSNGGGGCFAATAAAARFTGSPNRSIQVSVSTMILPQVHLRKPCYDFSFL